MLLHTTTRRYQTEHPSDIHEDAVNTQTNKRLYTSRLNSFSTQVRLTVFTVTLILFTVYYSL